MILDKALERALHIVTSGFCSPVKKNSQLVISVNDTVRTLQNSQTNRQDNQKLSSGGARPKREFLPVRHRGSRENGDRNRKSNRYNKSGADKYELITTLESNR